SEPMPQTSITAGVDLVFFSGDKLLGGPQSGIIVGKKDIIAQIRRQPLTRTLRLDKLSLAALSFTLIHYVKDEATCKIPVWRMISMSLEEIETRVSSWLKKVGEAGKVIDGHSTIGGGSLPGETLSTKLLAISGLGGQRVDELARRLRLSQPPVVGRIDEDMLLLDPRTVLPEEDEALLQSLQSALHT
ncbi:MAG: aminotransferase class V-fold PLP-dependent enzyme, partial [Dehalococcoidia bacterium]